MEQQNTGDTRVLILQAAYQAFGKCGFDGTSMKTIAREAGIAPGSIYNHFTDKEELFTSVVRMGWDQFLAAFRQIGEWQISLKEKFETMLGMGFDLLQKAQPLLKGMFFGAHQRNLIQDSLEQFTDAWEQIIISRQPQDQTEPFYSSEQRKTLIKYIVMGVMLAVAMVQPKEMEKEMARIKLEVMNLVKKDFTTGTEEFEGSGVE